MIKKWLICLCVFVLCLQITPVHGEELKLAPNASASLLMEASSRQVLYSNHEKEKLFPASTTKIMTMILLFEAIEKGSLKWDEELTCSAYAASMGGSQIYLEEGEKMSVADLFKAISIASANDACVMIGERIAGTNDNFVKMMNEKAKELKLVNTHFVNPTGLHDDNHYTCALDLGTMAAYLIEMGGERLLQTTSLYDSYIREDTAHKFWLVNTNKLLKSYQGADGLKTGYTKEAGYCIVSTAKRNGLRLIAIVLKESDPKVRNQEVSQLLDYGFSLYENITLFQKNDVIEKVNIDNARVSQVEIIAKDDIQYVQDKNDTTKVTYQMNYTNLVPPLKKGEVVGHLLLMRGDINIGSFDVTVKTDVEALSFVEKVVNQLKVLL
ncbi:D-alanyl-D-alanine carboxypeptidase [Massilimicrobiota sp. An142]|uniref:D-alanyl-D-alanine carboxypeptidase family protein n=1 Tax=Massilimicrobiota sp. An142 TaxID=1965564 RepID=UPI000B383451|nr:D-alanyl-D-alanine carboxypeptidase family protein [Massilimicrobiota sp. An142]OUQ14603.1 D-alanyl-D-alanine carboxypeptidase [Massilimicrobiota sp. An142]